MAAKKRAKRRAARKVCRKRASPKWTAFKRKYVKPGMSKTAYKAAVRKHWKPAKKTKVCKKRTAKRPAKRRAVRRTARRAR